MELVRLHSHGGFSVRSIITFCLTVIMTVFFWAIFSSSPLQAQSPATWQNDSTLLYDGQAYQSGTSTLDPSHGLAEGTTIFTYIEPAGQSATSTRGAYFIYFAPGTDPPTATTAEYARYTLVNTTFSNPQDQRTITMTPQGEESDRSSCEVSGGLGWIICPVTIFLANTMDSLFDQVAKFLAVKPLTLDPSTENGLYNVWNVMRNVANVAFVIAFLILIYSQITSLGASNYGMKKMIPRLIVAAILVNVSFVICALAIDISNILGFSIQDILISIRENAFAMTDNSTAGNQAFNATWAQAAMIVLGGGGAIAGIVYAATSGAAIAFLLPLVATLATTLFVVLLVLAARQAIIVILVIIAPLAFVANLLPNTEKWFGKWRDLFMTMLIFFPAFSFVFGGSQLAGQIIIQNAGDDIIMVLFGMGVQIAPLIVTPLLLKLSGNLIGRIAQIANNPNKGLVDRSRNLGKALGDKQRQKNLGRDLKGRSIADPRLFANRALKANERRRRLREDMTASYKQEGDNRYKESKQYGDVFDQTEAANLTKEALHNEHQAHFDKKRQTQPAPDAQKRGYESIYDRGVRAEASKDSLTATQNRTTEHYNRLRSNPGYTSPLYMANLDMETSKTNLEASESDKTAYITQQRALTDSPLGVATTNAAASKERLEASQQNLEGHLDIQRRTAGTKLNLSNTKLETAKEFALESKSLTQAYINAEKLAVDSNLHLQTVKSNLAQHEAQQSEGKIKSVLEEYKAGHVPAGATPELTPIIGRLAEVQQEIGMEAQRTANATKVINDNFADVMIASEDRRIYAGGIHEKGPNASLASAINTVRSSYNQSVTEAGQIIKHMELTSGVRQRIALLKKGESFTHTTEDGKMSYEFKWDDAYAREAAIEEQLRVGTIPDIEEIVMQTGRGGDLYEYRSTISDAVGKNGIGKRSKNLGGKTIDDILAGDILGLDGIIGTAVASIKRGKFSSKELANMDAEGVGRIADVANMILEDTLPSAVKQTIPDDEFNTIQLQAKRLAKLAAVTLKSDESVNITTASQINILKLADLYDNSLDDENPEKVETLREIIKAQEVEEGDPNES